MAAAPLQAEQHRALSTLKMRHFSALAAQHVLRRDVYPSAENWSRFGLEWLRLKGFYAPPVATEIAPCSVSLVNRADNGLARPAIVVAHFI
jgi:hypothetical protein